MGAIFTLKGENISSLRGKKKFNNIMVCGPPLKKKIDMQYFYGIKISWWKRALGKKCY